MSWINHEDFLQKEFRIKIRKTDSLHWPWVGAAFLWQISEIVGHTNSFSFGELENLIMWYKTQLSSVPTSVRRGFSLVSFLFTWKVLHTFRFERKLCSTKKISDRSKRKFWIKDLTLDYYSFEICHLKILVKVRSYWKSLICHLKIWRGNLELIFNWNALPWFPYLTCKREIQRFLLCWPDSSQWVEFYSLGAFQIFIFQRY